MYLWIFYPLNMRIFKNSSLDYSLENLMCVNIKHTCFFLPWSVKFFMLHKILPLIFYDWYQFYRLILFFVFLPFTKLLYQIYLSCYYFDFQQSFVFWPPSKINVTMKVYETRVVSVTSTLFDIKNMLFYISQSHFFVFSKCIFRLSTF